MKYAIEIKKLKKQYKDFILNIDELNIPSGVIVGLIGENGAGKTTLIKLMLNAINKDAGHIKIFNKDLEKEELIIKEDIGVVLDNSFFPETLNAKNINDIMNNIYKNWDKNLFYSYLKDFKINDTQILKSMSKGMRKKVEIATALSHHPKLLILDEATSNVDTRTEELIQKAMDKLTVGRTSFVIAHRLSTIRNADLILVMKDGDIIEFLFNV